MSITRFVSCRYIAKYQKPSLSEPRREKNFNLCFLLSLNLYSVFPTRFDTNRAAAKDG